ncbi:hypothetical protein F5X96DRAFT_615284 [Biscogniauxia mediterranea]|nr:hypothetical protein F5X96DRAFT_615284 [Biscogniauxia mediterranea]
MCKTTLHLLCTFIFPTSPCFSLYLTLPYRSRQLWSPPSPPPTLSIIIVIIIITEVS